MSTVEVGVSIEERMVTVDRGPASKSAKYKLLLTVWLARIQVLANGVGGVLRAPHSPRAAANCALAMALAALTTAAA